MKWPLGRSDAADAESFAAEVNAYFAERPEHWWYGWEIIGVGEVTLRFEGPEGPQELVVGEPERMQTMEVLLFELENACRDYWRSQELYCCGLLRTDASNEFEVRLLRDEEDNLAALLSAEFREAAARFGSVSSDAGAIDLHPIEKSLRSPLPLEWYAFLRSAGRSISDWHFAWPEREGWITFDPVLAAEHQTETKDGRSLYLNGGHVLGYVEGIGDSVVLDIYGAICWRDHSTGKHTKIAESLSALIGLLAEQIESGRATRR